MSTAALPMPKAPSTVAIFLTETRYEFVRALRTRAYSLSVIGFPVVFYLFFGLLMNRGQQVGNISFAKYMLGSYAVFGAVGAALFGVGVGLAGDLSAGWLELKRASPMPPVAYLAAKCVAAMGFAAIIASVLTLMGILFGGVHLTFHEFASMLGLVTLGAIPFASMGLLIALLAPFNSAPGITNLLYLPMSFLGGLWMPIRILPEFLRKIAPLFPTYHLAQLTVRVLGYPSTGSIPSHLNGLVSFTVVMMAFAFVAFRRREENS